MCSFCEVRLKTIREMRQELRQLERAMRKHEGEVASCMCKAKPLKDPERQWYYRQYYQANRERKLAAAKAKRAGAVPAR